jgi:hypothetical protein
MRTGEGGVIRGLSFDQVQMQIHLEIEQASGNVKLAFPLRADTGPRNGHMQDYFELGEDVTTPRVIKPIRLSVERKMIVPPPEQNPEPQNASQWSLMATSTDGPDRLEAIEVEMRQTFQHIGVAASIAEIYAERMRAFQRAGNEPRAIAAFRLAMEWMSTYAGWATSGGEGEALSYERDQFRKALALEFGYDPTDDDHTSES